MRCKNIIKKTIRASGLQIEDIDEVILNGASTKLESIEALASNMFKGRVKQNQEEREYDAVCGAAIYSGLAEEINESGRLTIAPRANYTAPSSGVA